MFYTTTLNLAADDDAVARLRMRNL